MTTLIVDWLGRGGIAQTTMRWQHEIIAGGGTALVASIAGRELEVDYSPHGSKLLGPVGALVRHHRLASIAARAIDARRPETVIVQNFIAPVLEQPVHDAARRVGARLIVVMHDHRSHSLLSGSRRGLRTQLRDADLVVCHSDYVRDSVAAFTGRHDGLESVPLPTPSGCAGDGDRSVAGASPTAVHFGVLKRRYKGTDVVKGLAGLRPAWHYVVLGVGAPRIEGATVRREFVPDRELRAAVAAADVALFPYRFATQSGAVRLAQALGTVPIATAVGGITEQIQDGVTGRLVPLGADPATWADALDDLADAATRRPMAAAARRTAAVADAEFAASVRRLAA